MFKNEDDDGRQIDPSLPLVQRTYPKIFLYIPVPSYEIARLLLDHGWEYSDIPRFSGFFRWDKWQIFARKNQPWADPKAKAKSSCAKRFEVEVDPRFCERRSLTSSIVWEKGRE